MLVNISCSKCSNSLGILQYTDHYYCKNHHNTRICRQCYHEGKTKCPECGENLSFHDAEVTKRWQKDNNILY